MFKRLFCKHEYHLVSSFKKDIDSNKGYAMTEVFIIYCPKCRKQRKVLKYEYEGIMNKQKLDKEYDTKG